jgi:hypothetical protein
MMVFDILHVEHCSISVYGLPHCKAVPKVSVDQDKISRYAQEVKTA